jgi:hypothetical protein
VIGALKSEYRKLFSTRMWWVLILCAVAFLTPTAVIMAVVLAAISNEVDGGEGFSLWMGIQSGSGGGDATMAMIVYSVCLMMPYIFPVLIGALSVTQEYRHKTITPTFLAEPRRAVVMGAKLIAAIPMGLVYGAASLAAVVIPVAVVFIGFGQPTGLDSWEAWGLFGRSLLAMSIWAVLGVGVGILVHNQVAAIVGVLVFTQVLEPTLAIGAALAEASMGAGGWTKILNFLPSSAGGSIQAPSFSSMDMGMGMTDAGGLSWGWAALVLLGWAALLAGSGYLFTWRRDVS